MGTTPRYPLYRSRGWPVVNRSSRSVAGPLS